MTTIAKRTIKLPYSVNHTTDHKMFTSAEFKAKAAFNNTCSEHSRLPAKQKCQSRLQRSKPHGRNLISSISPTILRSLTVIRSNVLYPSRTTVLQLDCTPSALTAREARDPRKNPSNTDFTEPTSYSLATAVSRKKTLPNS